MIMHKGKQSVDVHPSQIDLMKSRGWAVKKPPTKKPKKVTTTEADNGN
tara:strand:+ start:271 stop:414 length:144 start_codon:yes stop_codon:yes gene_type:complete